MEFMRIHVDCQPSDPPQVLLKLNSSIWDEQHRAIVCLLQATETSDYEDELANAWLQNWTDAQIQSLLQSLAVAVTNLRSQVSRAAIHLVRNLSHRLSNKPLETESFRLIPALLSRIGGDSSTAFIRTEAHDCLFVLIGRINPLCAVGCLNTAVNSGHGRSSMGRNAIAAALAAVLPSLVGLEGWQQPGGGPIESIRTTTDLRGKRKEYFDRLLKNVAIFLADGNQETRIFLSMVGEVGFIALSCRFYLQREVNGEVCLIDNIEEHADIGANPRLSSKARKLDPLQTSSVLNRSTSCPRPAPASFVPNFSNTAPVDNPVSSTVRKDDPGKRNANDVPATADDLFTSGVNAAQKAEFDGERFPPGLLALLFFHEDAEGFTAVMDILANHLACPYPGVASLAREACEMIRKILGPEALVKPLLHGQHLQEDPDKRAILIEELSDVTADLNTPSVLLDQYLVPEVLQLTSVAARYATSERLQSAMQSFVRCVYNQAGDTLLQAAKAADATEPLETTLECA
ncbi:unnamed protein product [Dibothriocephalus latus]|uniref:Uncharacterized protein n=1 Tax=Dibothriocephalus latus TaxID=60516 RepID=A0A3P7KZB7_DIBLA|nr:unnamed protein product [Dibothriocephalus latus]